MRSFAFGVWVLLVSVGCGGDDRGGGADDAGGGRDGGPRMDGGPRPDTGPATDSGPAVDSGPGEIDAAPDCCALIDCRPGTRCDSASCACEPIGPDCCRDIACPDGWFCNPEVCECVSPDCCAAILCVEGTVCNPATCACEPGGGDFCCRGGTPCAPGTECSMFSCRCEVPPTCDPPCAPDAMCTSRGCIPRCLFGEPCPDGMLCGDGGCVPAACSDTDCWAYSPIQHCDPLTGCYDPCARGDWSWCTSRGGRCEGGACIDDSCSVSGRTLACAYAYDCCGEAFCQEVGSPDPPCPFSCTGTPRPVVSDSHCVCDVDGGCSDLRTGGGRPVPLPGDPPPPPR